MKKLLIILGLAAVAIATLPLWGSCELNAKVCDTWCGIRHFNSDVRSAACKGSCATDRLRCLTDKGAKKFESFVEELKK